MFDSSLHRASPSHRTHAASRGSVLLMVVAVLALMAIIAVAYTTLGRADRASSAALVRESRIDDQAAFFKDYLAQVIADDVCSTYAERRGDNTWVLRREAMDYPGTSDALASAPAALADGATRFTPTGSYQGAWTGTGIDLRRPSDPWLASTEPARLMPPGSPPPPTTFAMTQLDDWRSWPAISNFAPDGRFVNLVNLRGNFNALPGFSAGAPWRMSSRLNLLDANDNPTNDNLINGAPVDPNYEYAADFSNNQFRAFRPMFDDLRPDDPAHVNNQWADTDGDGFADARWTMPVDAFDQNLPKWLLPQAGRARLFFAARAIDLSGLINVNTAGDFLYEPRALVNASGDLVHYPAGLTPADIDLRRFLGMGDLIWTFRGGAGLFGYNAFHQAPGVADYTAYTDPPGNPASLDIGSAAYAAIRYSINTGEALPGDARRSSPSNDPRLQFNASQVTPNTINPNPLNDAQRARFYSEFGADPASARNREVGGSYVYRAPFGVADEIELRTFNGVNDSDHLSPLERATGGREVAQFGPLRENRPRAVEMQGRPDSSTGQVTRNALLSTFADIRHLLTTDNGARPIVDNPAAGVSAGFLGALEFKTDALALLSKLDRSSGTAPLATDIQALFDLYVNALMPYTDETRYPGAWNRSLMQSRGLSYGESAELAQRISAHLVANLIDAIDSDVPAGGGYDRNTPTRVALEAVTGAPTNVDFESTNVLSVRDNLRPAVGENLHGGSPRLNIYGIEAQPFIIEVGWVAMFADAPYNPGHAGEGADDDYTLNQIPPIPPQTEPTLGPVTINDHAVPNNADFLFEVLAFQLNNPFDHDLQLSSGGEVNYYIEYANRFFALAETSANGATISTNDVIIPAYGTKVFYVLNIKNPNDIFPRLRAAQYTPINQPSQNIPADFITRWAEQQFGMGAVRIPMMHLKTRNVVNAGGAFGGGGTEFVDFFGETSIPAGAPGENAQAPIGAPPTSTEQRKVANLWRVFRTAPTDPAGDILLDRIKDPSVGTGVIAEARARSTDDKVSGTEAGNDRDSDRNNDKDNTAFALTKWAAFRRPTGEGYQRGSMPAWTVEAKLDNSYPPSANLRNVTQDGPSGRLGDRADYVSGSQAERRSTLDDLLVAQRTSETINPRIKARAEDKTGNPPMLNESGRTYQQAAVQVQLSGGRRNPQLFSRAGDFLLPLAIGPSYDPLRGPGLPTRAEQLEARWMTLSEALALASDYYSPPPINPSTSRLDPLYRLGHTDPAGTTRPRLDRGNLVLDNFTPYIDLNTNGTFEPDVDEPLGRGVPLAYNIVDIFNTTDRWKQNSAGNLVPRTQANGGPRTRIPGLININTAPASVLRMIPLFAPDTDPDSWTRTGAMPQDIIYDPATTTMDIASTVVAYRDKTALATRPTSTPGTRRILNFRDDNDNDASSYDGRFKATRIAAIREQPGFKSAAEILALRNHDPANATPTRLYENSIDRFADPSGTPVPQPRTSLESTLWKDPSSGAYEADKLVNDYDEQLAIANAALNCITVRSDVFCVWFLIHGYLPSDVENLAPADPMIPSIARRYVMVVDRSNVVSVGQKPRILLFQEVPAR